MAGVAWGATGCASTAPTAPECVAGAGDGQPRPTARAEDREETGRFDTTSATFAAYLERALEHNLGLRAAADRRGAALERIPQAGGLDDPSLSFEYFVAQTDQRYQARVAQRLPAFGVRRLREKAADAGSRAALHELDAVRFDVVERLARAFHDYAYLERATAVTEEMLDLVVDLERSLDARYRSGSASFAEVVRAQIERDLLISRIDELRDRRRVESVRLAAVVNLPAEPILPWPAVVPAGSVEVDEAGLAARLADLNPELHAADARIESAARDADVARRTGRPQFMVGAGWMAMRGMDGGGDETDVGLMAGVTLPVWRGRYGAARREADARLRAAVHERGELGNRLRARLSASVFAFRDAERRIDLLDNVLVRKAELVIAAAEQAYTDGSGSAVALLEAQRTLLDLRLQAERARADREIALADIGCCVGVLDVEALGRAGDAAH